MSVKPATAIINVDFVKECIARQELKLWWIAEQIKVDRKTISRWLNGKVKWVKMENIEALANLLEAPIESLTLKSEADISVTAEDYSRAAELISAEMHTLVRTSYNWKLLEYVIKTSLAKDLPQDLLGALYLDLSQAYFFQNKIKLCEEYVNKCLDIAETLDHQILYWDAMSVKAMAETCAGSIKKALSYYQRCMDEDPDPKREWKNRANYIAAIEMEGDFEKGLSTSSQRFEDFAQDSSIDDMSWAIAYLAHANLHVQCGYLDEGLELLDKVEELSRGVNFTKGIYYSQLLALDFKSQSTPDPSAIEKYRFLHDKLRAIQDDQLYYHNGARILGSLGAYGDAIELIQTAIRMAKDYPLEQGIFQQQLMWTQFRMSKSSAAKKTYQKAKACFEQAEAEIRLSMLNSLYREEVAR